MVQLVGRIAGEGARDPDSTPCHCEVPELNEGTVAIPPRSTRSPRRRCAAPRDDTHSPRPMKRRAAVCRRRARAPAIQTAPRVIARFPSSTREPWQSRQDRRDRHVAAVRLLAMTLVPRASWSAVGEQLGCSHRTKPRAGGGGELVGRHLARRALSALVVCWEGRRRRIHSRAPSLEGSPHGTG
jgi:hypothetical protein